jgi:hypothetical protein
VNLVVLPLTFISNIWFPIDSLPQWLKTIAGIFPIKALASSLEYLFDPRHHGAGLDGSDLKVLVIWTVVGVFLMLRFLRKPMGDAGVRAMWLGRGSPWGPDRRSSWARDRGSPWARGRGNGPEPFGPARSLGLLVWAVLIVVPVVEAITNNGSGAGHILAIAGAVAFSGVYVRVVITWIDEKTYKRSVALAGVMLVLRAC